MNKLDELFKPKITKDEAVTLLKIIYRRFKEIAKQYEHLCTGDSCEECPLDGDCEYLDTIERKWQETVELLEKALDIAILLDFDGCVIVTIYNVIPDDDDKLVADLQNIGLHSLKLVSKVYNILDPIEELEFHYFEWVTKSDFREDWRDCIRFTEDYWLEECLKPFFNKLEVDSQ